MFTIETVAAAKPSTQPSSAISNPVERSHGFIARRRSVNVSYAPTLAPRAGIDKVIFDERGTTA